MERATTLKEIAYELNLSINTVSRALRDCDDISKDTKNLVIETAINMGYMPRSINQFASKDGDSKLIVIISGNSKNFFYLLCSIKISSCLMQNYHYSTSTINCATDGVGVDVIKQCILQRVDGIISLLSLDDEALQICKLNKIPVVCVGRADMLGKTNNVHMDVQSGAKLWANYLVNFHNSNRIIYISLNHVNYEDEYRYNFFVESLRTLVRDADIPRYKYMDKKIVDEIHSTNGDLSIVCFNDELAYLLIDKLNVDVPNIRRVFPHFHILGFDSLSTHLSGLLDLTSIDYDYDELANQACVALSECFNKETYVNDITKLIPVKLHVRRIV